MNGSAIAHAVIDRATRDQLEALARQGDRSIAAEIRRALRLHVEREQTRHDAKRTEDPCSPENSQTKN